MVSEPVPAVVGTAIIGMAWFLLLSTPSNETTSSFSGLFAITAIAFAVSITEPPPTAIIKSALLFLKSSKP